MHPNYVNEITKGKQSGKIIENWIYVVAVSHPHPSIYCQSALRRFISIFDFYSSLRLNAKCRQNNEFSFQMGWHLVRGWRWRWWFISSKSDTYDLVYVSATCTNTRLKPDDAPVNSTRTHNASLSNGLSFRWSHLHLQHAAMRHTVLRVPRCVYAHRQIWTEGWPARGVTVDGEFVYSCLFVEFGNEMMGICWMSCGFICISFSIRNIFVEFLIRMCVCVCVWGRKE